MIQRLVSGGQTGVDRAALDVALALGIDCGGWCPRGRRAEDGTVPPHYPLKEAAGEEYPERTERNVTDSDGTLILCRGAPDRGTALTASLARKHRKPLFVVDLKQPDEPAAVRRWLEERGVAVLNVAGPRESSAAGIYQEAAAFLRALLG